MVTLARRVPRLVRTARAGLPEAAVRAALTDGTWQREHALRTVSDTAVVMVRGPGGQAGALKVAVTPSGAASLRREHEVLTRLGCEEALGAWRELVPVPLRWSDADGVTFLLTTRLPGHDTRRAPHSQAARLTRAAFAAATPLHEHGQMVAKADETLLRRLLAEPAEHLRGAVRSGQSVQRMVTAVHAGLDGTPLVLGWTHGDFYPGNVLAGADGRVSGIVDWDQAREHDPVALDLMFWLLTAPAPGRRREFGARVAARLRACDPWTPAERGLLGRAGEVGPAAGRALLLLVWLRHVAGNLAKSGRYAGSPVWLHRNVRPVLAQVARG